MLIQYKKFGNNRPYLFLVLIGCELYCNKEMVYYICFIQKLIYFIKLMIS